MKDGIPIPVCQKVNDEDGQCASIDTITGKLVCPMSDLRNQENILPTRTFKGYFLRLENRWFLEITLNYHFTKNGFDDYPYRDELLKGIKRLERNPAVVGQLLIWADFLNRPMKTLFDHEYPFLSFGNLEKVDVHAGIPDNVWYAAEEGIEKRTMSSQENQPVNECITIKNSFNFITLYPFITLSMPPPPLELIAFEQ
ncbi:MAG: hypothetical protein ABI904_14175 [Chloroflexota bacterium]